MPNDMTDKKIDEMELNVDIGSHEGISLNYITRDRMAFVLGQNQTMITQTQFADAKAGAMLAFLGLIATRGPGAVTEIDAASAPPELILQLVLHAAALICCLIVLFPRYAKLNVRRNLYDYDRFSWPALTSDGASSEGFAGFMRTSEVSQLVASVARSNHTLAAILLSKFAWLRWAFGLGVIDVLFMAGRLFTS